MIILLGSTGRIGRLVASLCKMQQHQLAVADRRGDVFLDGRLIGNLWTGLSELGDSISIADCSIDYSSIPNMQEFEAKKRGLVNGLACEQRLVSYLTISSGAVDFDDALIKSEFYLAYKYEKLRNDDLAAAVGCNSYSPRVYTLIGKESFHRKGTGWVNVIEQCLQKKAVIIDERNELRSWVSEQTLQLEIAKWLRGEGASASLRPISGHFSMGQIVHLMENHLQEAISIGYMKMDGWLSVPYLAREITRAENLAEVISSCLQS